MSLLGAQGAFAQFSKLNGTVVEKVSHKPIQYANVSLTYLNDSSVYGTITNERGEYLIDHLKEGKCKLNISFIGYQTYALDSVFISRGKNSLEKVDLDILTENLEEVIVTTNGSGIVYNVDRKVIQAQNFPGADVAMDLLVNIPSLQVDIDGNLTYRGDGTFSVYINGHLVKDGEEKLRQLSANEIEYIEIITNPSAKYSAEGTAGIIQVILKRNRLEGYLVSTTAKTSTLGSYEWLFSVDQKGERGGWYLKGQLEDYVSSKSTITTHQMIYQDAIENSTFSVIDKKFRMENNYLELGLNYDLTKKDYIDFNISVDPLKRSNIGTYKGFYEDQNIVSSEIVAADSYLYDALFELYYKYFETTLSYEHAFSKDRNHLLSAYISYSGSLESLNEKKVDTKIYDDFTETVGYMGGERGEKYIEGNVGYKNKLTESSTLEIGSEIKLFHIPEISYTSGYVENEIITPFSDEPEEQKVDFKQNIYAGYLSFNSKFGDLEYMLGFRTEYTDRYSNYDYINDEGESCYIPAEKDFIDFFPSAHVLYSFSEEKQLSASFSRRISRPDYWSLIPLSRYETPYIYYTGNGDLSPSYASSYELNYLLSWDKNYFSTELFARKNKNVKQSYYSIIDDNKILFTKRNVGYSWSIGTELMLNINIYKWWNTNFTSSLFWYKLNVELEGEERFKEKFRTDYKLNNTFKIGNSLSFKSAISYCSSSVYSQLKQEAYWYSNMALKKSFADRKWQLQLAWTNVFNTMKYHTFSEGDGFYVDTYFERSPFVSMTITYRLDNQE